MKLTPLLRRTNPHRTLRAIALCSGVGTAAMAAYAQAPQDSATPSAPAASAPTPSAPLDLRGRVNTLVQRVKGELVFLPGGSFDMGDWGSEVGSGLPYDMDRNSKPLHKVTLDGFSMMAYKATYDDFDLFTDAVGEERINEHPEWRKESRAPRKPAGVNWYGAKAYCQWLGKLSGLPFDLPTEAQWEYAARSGGKRVLFATDNGNIDKGRNFPDDLQLIKDLRVADIGTYPPNPAGLYGMLDHAGKEWVNDWYAPDYYKHSPRVNPRGPARGTPLDPKHPDKPGVGPAKVLRGMLAGGNVQFGGFVFSRGRAAPRHYDIDFGSEPGDETYTPTPGYSALAGTQFRCAVNQPRPTR